jgi:hypothetical protein
MANAAEALALLADTALTFAEIAQIARELGDQVLERDALYWTRLILREGREHSGSGDSDDPPSGPPGGR